MPEGGQVYRTQAGLIQRRPPLSGLADLAEGISSIFVKKREKEQQDFERLLKAVELGLVDPNEALVQGTEGGRLFEKFLRSLPPKPPSEEVTPGMPAQTLDYVSSPDYTADLGAPVETPAVPEVRKRVGGFQPRTPEALKRWIIEERRAGREVDPHLELYAGFAPKTRAQLQATNPKLAAEMERIRQDPKWASIFERELTNQHTNYPDAPLESKVQAAIDAVNAFRTGKVPASMPKEDTLGKTKEAKKSELAEKRLKSRSRVQTIDKLTRAGIGADVALEIADHLDEGGTLADFPMEDKFREQAEAELARKERTVDARMLSAQARAAAIKLAQKRSDVAIQRLDFDVERFNRLHKIAIESLNDRRQQNFIIDRWRVIAERMKNPATRSMAEAESIDFANSIGMEVSDPTGVQGLWEWIGRSIGQSGWGSGALHSEPFNPPKVTPTPAPIPKPSGAAPSSGTPAPAGKADDFIKRLREAREAETERRQREKP